LREEGEWRVEDDAEEKKKRGEARAVQAQEITIPKQNGAAHPHPPSECSKILNDNSEPRPVNKPLDWQPVYTAKGSLPLSALQVNH
jgi:hypothetical protein